MRYLCVELVFLKFKLIDLRLREEKPEKSNGPKNHLKLKK
jgi:hypothetical protein